MKNIRFGLTMKLGFGFGIVIVIMLILGGIAAWNMTGVQRQSTILDQEYMSEVNMASKIERSVHNTMYAIRGYAFSEDTQYLEEGLTHITEVKNALQEARDLSDVSAHLTDLGEAISSIEDKVSQYEELIQANIQKNEEITNNRQVLEEAAAQYLQSCDVFLTNANYTLETEVMAGFPPERIVERLQKIILINDVIDLGNATRIETAQAQALREPQRIEGVQKNFGIIEQELQELLSMSRLDEDIQEIEDIQTAAQTYQKTMKDLLANWLAVQELDQQRATVADQVLTQAQASAERGMEETEKISESTVSSLSSASRILIIGVIVAAVLGIGAAITIARGIVGPMAKSVAFAQTVAEGDLMADVDVRQKDEIGLLADALRSMITKLRDIISEVKGAADNVADGSQAMSASAEQMSNGATEQAAAAEEASSSMEEMAANIRQNAENALQTEKIAVQAAQDAQVGGTAVAQTVQAMKNIVKQISIIEEIARQTHTLSLNATIEAAKAEEYGKGFAVVASEVRALASRSQTAAAEINSVAGESIAVAEKAGTMLEKLVPDIQKTAGLVQEINAASREQSSGAGQINRAIQQLDNVTQQNSATSEELSSTAEELSSQAEMLQQMVAFFTVDDGGRQRETFRRDASKTIHLAPGSVAPEAVPRQQGKPEGGNDEESDGQTIRMNGQELSGDERDEEFERY